MEKTYIEIKKEFINKYTNIILPILNQNEEERKKKRNSSMKKIYSIEYLRIIFLAVILFLHCCLNMPDLHKSLNYIAFSGTRLYICVEYFFVISGFFLCKKLMDTDLSAVDIIKKMYIRFFPAILFAYILALLFGTSKLRYIPTMLTYTFGMSLNTGVFHDEIIGVGDWFIGALFWTSALITFIFRAFPKFSHIILGILIYVGFALQLTFPQQDFLSPYYGIYGASIARAMSCMGVGMAVYYLSKKVFFNKNVLTMCAFTFLEVLCAVLLCSYAMGSVKITYFQNIINFSLLLFIMVNSYGYISKFLKQLLSSPE